MNDLDCQITLWNKNLTNYYNPKRVVEIKYYSKNNISFKLYIRKESELLDNNFRKFFQDKRNSTKLGGILKKLLNDYKFIQDSGSYFKGFFNPVNWKRHEKDYIIYEYFISK